MSLQSSCSSNKSGRQLIHILLVAVKQLLPGFFTHCSSNTWNCESQFLVRYTYLSSVSLWDSEMSPVSAWHLPKHVQSSRWMPETPNSCLHPNMNNSDHGLNAKLPFFALVLCKQAIKTHNTDSLWRCSVLLFSLWLITNPPPPIFQILQNLITKAGGMDVVIKQTERATIMSEMSSQE